MNAVSNVRQDSRHAGTGNGTKFRSGGQMSDVSGTKTLPTQLVAAELGEPYTYCAALTVANSFDKYHKSSYIPEWE